MENKELTNEEKAVILQLLDQVRIGPSQPDGKQMFLICQSIIEKLSPDAEKEKE